MRTETLHDGRTTFRSTDRVLVYVHYASLKRGCNAHQYTITPTQIRETSASFGEILMSCVFHDANVIDKVRSSWICEGFQVLDDGPTAMNQAPFCILRQVDVMHPDTVVIVGGNDTPSWLLAELRSRNAKVVLLSADRSATLVPHADYVLFLGDVVDGKPMPPFPNEPARESHVSTLLLSWLAPHESRRAMDYVQFTDPETYDLLEKLLAVEEKSADALLLLLKRRAEQETLPKLILAVIFVLGDIPVAQDADRRIRKNRLWERFLRNGIDIDTTGRVALRLLVEEGSLLPLDECDYMYARDHRDQSVKVAKAFCSSMVKSKRRVMFVDSTVDVADRILQALEIMMANPRDLTVAARMDICDLVLLLLASRTTREREENYAERGMRDEKTVLKFEARIREVLDLPPENTDEPLDEADTPSSPGIASTVRRRARPIRQSA